METNQPTQTTESPPLVTPEVSSPVNNDLNHKSSSKNKNVVLVLVLLILGLLAILVYLFYQNMQLKQQVELVELDKPTSATCDYNGQTYEVGEGFTASDGCNSCNCGETGQVACTEMVCDDLITPQTESFENWKTYSNSEYNLSFKYPSLFAVEDNLDTTEDRIQIYVKSNSNEDSFSMTIWRKYPPNQAIYFMDTESIGQKTIEGTVWDTYFLACGYRDGANNSPCLPTYALQTVVNENLYTITVGNQSSTTKIQNQILSTFEFTE